MCRFLSVRSAALVFLVFAGALSARAAEPIPFQMELLPGYKHEALQGIDSIVGIISHPDGLKIQYEIGRVSKPGELRLGGDFSDAAANLPAEQRRWLKERKVGSQQLHLAYSKEDLLVASFPLAGVNFHVQVKTADEMADALLMLLSFQPGGKSSAEAALATRVSLVIAQDSLETIVTGLGAKLPPAAGDLELRIIGSDLQLEGITRNQSIRNFKIEDATIAEVLTSLVQRANPVPDVMGPNDARQKLVWLVGPNPDDAKRQAILITTRAAAEEKGWKLPEVFELKK